MLDERTRHLRRLKRLRGSVRRWTVLAGGLTGVAAVVVPYQGLGAADAVWAGLAGASLVMAGWRWSDARALAAQPVPEPPDPALAGDRWLSVLGQFPGGQNLADGIRRQRVRGALRGSPAVAAWERLDRSARTMRALTGRLGPAEAGAVAEATGVERELRALTDQVANVEEALRRAPDPARESLRELRDGHVARLEQGVVAYEEFVVAAAGYVSESARVGDPGPPAAGLAEATQRLHGVTAGLAELRQLYGDLRAPG